MPLLRTAAGVGTTMVFGGLVLLVLAWLRLGRSLRSTEDMIRALCWWTAPLLAAPPLFSRDVYSYLAQGTMLRQGLDPYTVGPEVLGGQLAADVPAVWQHTPAPYGPVFLSAAAAVTTVAEGHTALSVIGMRLVAVASLGLLVRYVPELARRCGVPPAQGLWLGVLNPLVVTHLVAGAHNDALMVGLMVAGLAVTTRGRPVPGVVLVTLAALVKAPAAIALLFIVPLWPVRPGRLRYLRVAAATFAVAAVTTVAVSEAVGLGYGWLRTLDTPASVHNGLSISTDFGYLIGWLPDRLALMPLDHTIAGTRAVGLLAAVGIIAYAVWRAGRHGPVVGLGVSLIAPVALGPVVHPWYLVWGVAVLATGTATPVIVRPVVLASAALVFVLQPTGDAPRAADLVAAVAGVALAVMWMASTRLLTASCLGGWGARSAPELASGERTVHDPHVTQPAVDALLHDAAAVRRTDQPRPAGAGLTPRSPRFSRPRS